MHILGTYCSISVFIGVGMCAIKIYICIVCGVEGVSGDGVGWVWGGSPHPGCHGSQNCHWYCCMFLVLWEISQSALNRLHKSAPQTGADLHVLACAIPMQSPWGPGEAENGVGEYLSSRETYFKDHGQCQYHVSISISGTAVQQTEGNKTMQDTDWKSGQNKWL